jgi:hypothetical protein
VSATSGFVRPTEPTRAFRSNACRDCGDRDTTGRFFQEIGRVYAPFLLANARALQDGASQVECEIDGRRWVQQPFPYQGKCFKWLRERHVALSQNDRSFVDSQLSGTGAETIFSAKI